ncbi:hypothetical protein CsatB_001868 [Cannabis sativa]
MENVTSPLQASIRSLHPRNEWLLYTSMSLWLLPGLMTDPTDQHECFQRALSSLARILGKLPRRSPILEIAPKPSTLNCGVLSRWATEKQDAPC